MNRLNSRKLDGAEENNEVIYQTKKTWSIIIEIKAECLKR